MDISTIYQLAKRRGFFYPSYEIYGGVSGFFDYGPLGTLLKNNIIQKWREYYILKEGFAEIDGATIAPEIVFKASGHLEEFKDLYVKCGVCGEAIKADEIVNNIPSDTNKLAYLEEGIKKGILKCIFCNGELLEPKHLNLMFQTSAGTSEKQVVYLRPETAQTMFYNFNLLYRYFREKLPFGVVQIGKGYRNEISPRQGILRLREFNMAEAEIFLSPEKKWHNFSNLKTEVLKLYPKNDNEVVATLEDAVNRKIISSAALGYFMALTKKFLVDVGIPEEKLRFRQHRDDEIAHYAMDCWDAETLLSQGWVEVVGIADRGCYDLSMHSKYSSTELSVFEKYALPKEIEVQKIIPKKELIGRKYKREASKIIDLLEKIPPSEIGNKNEITVEIDGKKIKISNEFYELKTLKEKDSGVRYIPHVIEPSYGLDRIIYAILEHSYYKEKRDGEDYVILKLPPLIAPIRVGVFPLMRKKELETLAKKIDMNLRNNGLITYYDANGSIGRRYARMDEIGTPYCVTVDYESLKNTDVTIRERDTKKQARVKISALYDVLNNLVKGIRTSVASLIE